jgi:hypothetical protein
MGEANRVTASRAKVLLWLSLAVALASACSDGGDPDPDDGANGSAATAAQGSGGVAAAPAATGGAGASPGMQPSTGGSPAGAAGSGGATSSVMDAGAVTEAGALDSGLIADAGSPTSDAGRTSICAGGMVGKDSDNTDTPPSTLRREFAVVRYGTPAPNEILDLKTTLRVPKPPTSNQTLFIWPGLQSRNSDDPGRIGNGVLQPVLTWGGSCAPEQPSNTYDNWWISGMYVNVTTSAAGPTGCAGGDYLVGDLDDLIDIDMRIDGTDWIQTMTSQGTMETVDFTIDLKGQVQNVAMWIIEVPDGSSVRPADDVIFSDSVLTFSSPVSDCQPTQAGAADYFTAPVLSADGLHCCYDTIILRADR